MIDLRKIWLFGISCVVAALVTGIYVESAPQTIQAQDSEGGGRGRFRGMRRRGGGEMPSPPVVAPAEAPKTEEKKEEKKEEKPADDANKKPAVETVKRPDRPRREANRDELNLKPDKDGKVRFNFRGQQWTDLLEWYAEIANISLDWQEVPPKTVDLVTQQSYTLDEARDVLNRLLLDRGFTLVRNGEVLSVVNLTTLNPGLLPRVEPEKLAERDTHEFVKVSFQLDTLLAETAAEEFKGMMSTYGKLIPLKATNRLEAIDAVANLRELYALVSQEQSTKGQERLVVPFELKYTRAADVKEKLEALLGIEKKQQPAGPMTPEQMQQMQQQMQARAQQRGGAPGPEDKKTVFIVANERDNSILVSGPADKIAVVKQAVTLMDQPSARSGYADTLQGMRVYRLSGLDPESLVKTLQSQGNLDPKTHLEVDKTNNAVIAFATLIDHGKIRMMVDTLDGSGRHPKVIRLRKLPADYVAGTLTLMVNGDEEEQSSSRRRRSYGWGGYGGYGSQTPQKQDKFRATAEVEHNKLLLWANEVEMKLVEDFLIELGEIRPREGNPETVRMIEIAPGAQTDEMLKRLQQAWPNFAPNELKIEIQPEKNDDAKGEKKPAAPPERDLRTEREPKPKADGDSAHDVADAGRHTHPVQPYLRLVELQSESEASTEQQAPAGDAKADEKPVEPETQPAPSQAAPAENNTDVPDGNAAPSAEQPSNPEAEKKDDAELNQSPERKGKSHSPVTITRSPRGGIIIQSDDPRALDLLEELIGELAPAQPDFVEYHLKHADAWWIAIKLEDYFKVEEKKGSDLDSWFYGWPSDSGKDEKPSMLSKRKPLKFIDETDTNTIIVQGGDPSQLATIKKLIDIWDKPEPKDTQSARKFEAIQIRYSTAKGVAETIKEVYRDLLSDNDKSLQDNGNKDKEKKPSADRIYTYIDTGGGDENKKNPVRFKGLLSIGIDEVSNTLIISAPEWLLKDVSSMAEHLDSAAMPSSKVQVMQVDRRINSAVLQKKLAEVFGKRAAPGAGQPEQPGGEQGENGQDRGNGRGNGQRGGRRNGGGGNGGGGGNNNN